jgi:hypothetical protein
MANKVALAGLMVKAQKSSFSGPSPAALPFSNRRFYRPAGPEFWLKKPL